MTIGQLRAVITKVFSSATFPTDVDLVLDALNTAKLEAFQRVEFELSYQLVKGVVGSGGADLSAFTNMDGSPVVGKINALRNAWLLDNGHLCPVDLVTSGTVQTWQRRLGESDVVSRYPSDAEAGLFSGRFERSTFRNGNKVFYYPFHVQDVTMVYDASVWLPDYASDANEDWLTDNCFNYLKWAAIVELNPIFKAFVPRQEGNVTPEDAAKANAYDAMERWNAGIEAQVPVQR